MPKYTQIPELINTMAAETLGENAIVAENLQQVIESGKTLLNAMGEDNFVRKLADHYAKVIVVDEPYSGRSPAVLMDGAEFGSIMEKIRVKMPNALVNESYQLEDGTSYDPNIFYQPKVTVDYWDSYDTFQYAISRAKPQVLSAFDSEYQLAAFFSAIDTAVMKAKATGLDDTIERVLNNFMAHTIAEEYGSAALSSKSGIKAVNVLKQFNDAHSTSVTPAQARFNPEFLRYCSFVMSNYMDWLSGMSTLFNIGKMANFTPKSRLRVVMLSEFKNAADFYLQSDVFHNIYTALPNSDTVPFWQGNGKDFSFENTSTINVVTSENETVNASGVIAFMYDRYALGVFNKRDRVTSTYNEAAEFTTFRYKSEAMFFNDFNENGVVFFIA